MSEQLSVGTNFWSDPLVFNMLVPQHPIFTGIDGPYASGVPFMVRPLTGKVWDLTTGVGLARATPQGPVSVGDGLIVANQTDEFRSIYFPHYIEDLGDGSNQQDMQVFYNALVWTSAVPEPGTLVLLGVAIGGAWLARRTRSPRRRGCKL